jgi:hypothetical protein
MLDILYILFILLQYKAVFQSVDPSSVLFCSYPEGRTKQGVWCGLSLYEIGNQNRFEEAQ